MSKPGSGSDGIKNDNLIKLSDTQILSGRGSIEGVIENICYKLCQKAAKKEAKQGDDSLSAMVNIISQAIVPGTQMEELAEQVVQLGYDRKINQTLYDVFLISNSEFKHVKRDHDIHEVEKQIAKLAIDKDKDSIQEFISSEAAKAAQGFIKDEDNLDKILAKELEIYLEELALKAFKTKEKLEKLNSKGRKDKAPSASLSSASSAVTINGPSTKPQDIKPTGR
jgi:hypothetical protein